MGVNVFLDPQGVKVRLTFQSVSDPVRLSGGRRGESCVVFYIPEADFLRLVIHIPV